MDIKYNTADLPQITLNGSVCRPLSATLTYEQIAELCGQRHPTVCYVVRIEGGQLQGTLLPGEGLFMVPKLYISAYNTSNA